MEIISCFEKSRIPAIRARKQMSERLAFRQRQVGNKGATSGRRSVVNDDPRSNSGGLEEAPVQPARGFRRSAFQKIQRKTPPSPRFDALHRAAFLSPAGRVHALPAPPRRTISAVGALVAMVTGRISRGLTFSRDHSELGGVVLMGAIILFTAPFSRVAGWFGQHIHRDLLENHPDFRLDREYADVSASGSRAVRLADRAGVPDASRSGR